MASSHHLVVIMFADIAGYTAVMSDDEQNALELINRAVGYGQDPGGME